MRRVTEEPADLRLAAGECDGEADTAEHDASAGADRGDGDGGATIIRFPERW